MEYVTNAEGYLMVYSASNRIIPLIKLFLNGNETICLSERQRINFIRNILVYNPNTEKEYLCDIVFTGDNFVDPDLPFSIEDKLNTVHGKMICSPDSYGKFFEILVNEDDDDSSRVDG